MSSVTGIGRFSSGFMMATIAPFGVCSDWFKADTGAGTGAAGASKGFKSAYCTWCAANTSSLHSMPL